MAATYIKPDKIPKWADAAASITEPSDGFKNAGWVFNSKPPAAYENWKSKLIGDWFKWIDERLDDGATENEFVIRNPADATAALTISAASIVVTLPFVGAEALVPGVIAKQFGHEFVAPPSAVGIAGVGDTGVYGEGTLFGGRFLGLRDGGNNRPGVYGVGSEGFAATANGGVGVLGQGGRGAAGTTGGVGVQGVGGDNAHAYGGTGGDFSGGDGLSHGGYGLTVHGGAGKVGISTPGGIGALLVGGIGTDVEHGSGDGGDGVHAIGGACSAEGGQDGYGLYVQSGGSTRASMRLVPINGTPTGPAAEGDLFYDSRTKRLTIYADGSWHQIEWHTA